MCTPYLYTHHYTHHYTHLHAPLHIPLHTPTHTYTHQHSTMQHTEAPPTLASLTTLSRTLVTGTRTSRIAGANTITLGRSSLGVFSRCRRLIVHVVVYNYSGFMRKFIKIFIYIYIYFSLYYSFMTKVYNKKITFIIEPLV